MASEDAATAGDPAAAKIVLVSGSMRIPDRVGHHDYAGGCALLGSLLAQTPGVRPVVVGDGWPKDEAAFAAARTLLFYTDGGGNHPLLQSAPRRERVQQLVGQGVGLVMIHRAVRCPAEVASLMSSWLGGVYVPGKSARGHWESDHRDFVVHPVTHGVQPWRMRDGWHNRIQFVDGMRGVTPLLWSSATHAGSSAGGAADIVCWAYERPERGRSFCFTGLDAHSAWSSDGVRRLIVNGILWSAGLTIPCAGAPCVIDAAALRGYLTPRGSTGARVFATLRRGLRRLARERQRHMVSVGLDRAKAD